MLHRNTIPAEASGPPLRTLEFVALLASLMSLGALGIDTMLSALPEIAQRLGVDPVRDAPLIVTVFVVGLGIGQLIHGPLTDRFGRRPVLIVGLSGYIVASLFAGLSFSFPVLLLARFIGGLSIAATRVVTIALVRDCFSGRAMAQITSLAFMVFMAVPIVAPSIGQGILLLGSWRLIFEMIAGATALTLAWFAWRMPETLRPEHRRPLSARALLAGYRRTFADRFSLGYTIAATLSQGAIFGFIGSIQPIMERTFHHPGLLGAAFAASAGSMGVANLINSRIVLRAGMRRISQTALLVMVVLATTSLAVERSGHETLALFVVLQALTMGCFGLATANISAMAMENMSENAGIASSVQGFFAVTGGGLIGWAIGHGFDGSTLALHVGFIGAGLGGLAMAAIVERGRMFRPS